MNPLKAISVWSGYRVGLQNQSLSGGWGRGGEVGGIQTPHCLAPGLSPHENPHHLGTKAMPFNLERSKKPNSISSLKSILLHSQSPLSISFPNHAPSITYWPQPDKHNNATFVSEIYREVEKEMETHSCIPVWEIPWTEEPGRLRSMAS